MSFKKGILTTLTIALILCVSSSVNGLSLPSSDKKLILISFDGFRWNYLERANTPNFDRIVKNGVHVKRGLKNAFITKTFPNHFTLVTGLWEENHGIVGNEMYDPKLNQTFELRNRSAQSDPAWFDVGAEPIWVTNQLQSVGGRSGVIMWPGGGAPIKYVSASRFMEYDKVTSNETKIETLISWFLNSNPINLGLVYYDQPDRFGHLFGPESQQVTDMIEGLDKVVGYLLSRLEETKLLDTVNLIITSDHGFSTTPKSKVIDLDKMVDSASYRVLTESPIACIWPHEGRLEEVYDALKKGASQNGNFEVYKREEIPERYHYTKHYRISPILAVAKDTYSFQMQGRAYTNRGDHGYDNSLQDMHPFFIAMGPAFKKDFSVETFQSVDIYPLMCHLLDIVPGPNNGSMDVVSQLLAQQKMETSTITFATYIAVFIVIACVAAVFSVTACRHHRYIRRMNIARINQESSVYPPPSRQVVRGEEARAPLLGDDIH